MRKLVNITDILNKKILRVVGTKKKNRYVEAEVILFDDEETFIQLEEQDYYSYHDCSSSAKELQIVNDPDMWKVFNTDKGYANTTETDL